MKRLLVALTALLIAAAPAQAKMWLSQDGNEMLISGENDAFRYVTKSGTDTLCEIADWPISRPEALMKCDNGMEVMMRVIDNSSIIFNLTEMSELLGPTSEECPY